MKKIITIILLLKFSILLDGMHDKQPKKEIKSLEMLKTEIKKAKKRQNNNRHNQDEFVAMLMRQKNIHQEDGDEKTKWVICYPFRGENKKWKNLFIVYLC